MASAYVYDFLQDKRVALARAEGIRPSRGIDLIRPGDVECELYARHVEAIARIAPLSA